MFPLSYIHALYIWVDSVQNSLPKSATRNQMAKVAPTFILLTNFLYTTDNWHFDSRFSWLTQGQQLYNSEVTGDCVQLEELIAHLRSIYSRALLHFHRTEFCKLVHLYLLGFFHTIVNRCHNITVFQTIFTQTLSYSSTMYWVLVPCFTANTLDYPVRICFEMIPWIT